MFEGSTLHYGCIDLSVRQKLQVDLICTCARGNSNLARPVIDQNVRPKRIFCLFGHSTRNSAVLSYESFTVMLKTSKKGDAIQLLPANRECPTTLAYRLSLDATARQPLAALIVQVELLVRAEARCTMHPSCSVTSYTSYLAAKAQGENAVLEVS